jgi:sigma-B regulation protein RsbU (phosphoserine phosphatase)
MAVPLCNLEDVTGLIYLETLEKPERFEKKDLRLLTLLGNAAATQIQNTQLLEDKVRRQHLQEGVREAAKIQERLLPVTFGEIPGYEFEWAYVSCFEVGGDYCDCLPLGRDHQGIVIADVAGKGLGAAMLMAVTQATLHTHAQVGLGLDRLAVHMNRAIYTAAPDNRFVTFFFAELDHTAHRLRYINAGHQPAPILVRSSGVMEELGAGSIPLGMMPEVSCPVREVMLEPADFLFACTDGVTDAVDPEENMFGEDRLRKLLASLAGFPSKKIRGAVETSLADHARGAPQPDDVAMAVLRRKPDR